MGVSPDQAGGITTSHLSPVPMGSIIPIERALKKGHACGEQTCLFEFVRSSQSTVDRRYFERRRTATKPKPAKPISTIDAGSGTAGNCVTAICGAVFRLAPAPPFAWI